MEKNTTENISINLKIKIALTLACLCLYPLRIGFSDGSSLYSHLLYSFCHANIFHMIVNLSVLWCIKNPIHVFKAILIAVLVSFLPMYVDGETLGLSAFLFSQFGISWGRTRRTMEAIKKVLPFILITMLVANVNGLLHLYAFGFSYIVGYAFDDK